ncbi:MAG: potassium-transporting ATPase subunit KdpC [Chloroflexota bacterium]|nr:potassium-transporting ATPase subunit KdpC [Chloroflexota bacterium]
MLQNTFKDLRTAIIAFVAVTALTGLAYPYAITGIAQAVFHRQANGSLVSVDGQDVGSSLVGQNFASPAYFHPRPSAAGTNGYDGSASSGSNLGPSSQVLATAVAGNADTVRSDNNLASEAKVPVDAVTASGSGLDPHVSPAYAQIQIPRVAKERGVAEADVKAVVDQNTDGATLGVLGEARVNVLRVNLELDNRYGKPAISPAPAVDSSAEGR